MIYILPVLAVLLSFFLVYRVRPEGFSELRLLLAFSGAFLLALTIFELFPSVYESGKPKLVGLFIMAGILLQIFLEFFSKGAEHGHIHLKAREAGFPWMLFISLSIHAFLEGIPVDGHATMLFGILVHKMPIALVLSVFFLGSGRSFRQAFLFMIFFSLMTPLGTLAAAHVPLLRAWETPLTALVIGVFLHISTVILFESSEGHSFNIRKLIVIFLGILFAYML